MIFNKLYNERKEIYDKATELIKTELDKCKDKKLIKSISFESQDPDFISGKESFGSIIYYDTYKYFIDPRSERDTYSKEFEKYQDYFYNLTKLINLKIEKLTDGKYYCVEHSAWNDGFIGVSSEPQD